MKIHLGWTIILGNNILNSALIFQNMMNSMKKITAIQCVLSR